MADYKERFRERFPTFPQVAPAFTDEFLAFIEEVVTESRKGFDNDFVLRVDRLAREEERQRITSLIEELADIESDEPFKRTKCCGYHQALDDLRSKIRGEDGLLRAAESARKVGDAIVERHAGTNCDCVWCENLRPQSGTQEECKSESKSSASQSGFREEICSVSNCNCLEEDKRILQEETEWEARLRIGDKPFDREETECCEKCYDVYFDKTWPAHTAYPSCIRGFVDCPCHKPRTEETEKEGASFSGRGLWVTCEKDYKNFCAHWHFEKCDHECHNRPEKTNTPPTPQSREQGGEKL